MYICVCHIDALVKANLAVLPAVQDIVHAVVTVYFDRLCLLHTGCQHLELRVSCVHFIKCDRDTAFI